MEPSKRKAEVVDLTADLELASRPPKRPRAEGLCVIDLSPIVVDLASDAEAAAAPANPCLPHTSFPPSPQVVDSDDDAPAGRMALADGHCAAMGGKLQSQDQKTHGGGTAATQGCPGPEISGNMNTGKANVGLTSGVQDAGQLSARAVAVAPAVSAFFGQFASASNPFQAAAALLAATGKPPPQALQALLTTALQPSLPATLPPMPRPAAAVQPSFASAAHSQQLLQVKGASPGSASGTRAAEDAAPCGAAEPEAAQPPWLLSTHASAPPAAAAAEGGRSEDAALSAEGQLPHLRPVKVPPRMMPAQEEAPSNPAMQAAAVSPSSSESSSGMLLAPHEASAEVNAVGMPESNTLDNPLSNMGKAAPGHAAADSPYSSATEGTLMGGPAEAAGAAVCSTSASPPSRAACGLVVGIVCDSNNSDTRPRQDARIGGIASITDRIPAALASGNLASADVDGPVSTPNVAPGCSSSAGITAAVAAAAAPTATAAPSRTGTPGAAAGAQGLGHLDAPEDPLAHTDSQGAASQGATTAGQAAHGAARLDAETPAKLDANPGPLSRGNPSSRAASEDAGMIGVPGSERDALGAPSELVGTRSGAAATAAAAPRASAGPGSRATVSDRDVAARADARIELQGGPVSSATFTDSDVALGSGAGTELQSKNRAEVGVAGSSAAGAGSCAAGGLPQQIRSPPQRLEPTFRGKKHTMAAVGTSWTADDAWQGSRRGRGRRGRSGGGLGGTIPRMFRCNKSGRGRPKGMPACEQESQEDGAAPSAPQAEESQPKGLQRHSDYAVHRGLQRSAATEVPGQAAGAGTCPVILSEESNGGDASSLQRSAATDVRKRRRRAMILLEDSEMSVPPVEGAGCLRQLSSSEDIWLSSGEDTDEGEEEVAPEICCRPSATAQVAMPSIDGLASNAAHAAAVGEHITGTQGMAQRQGAAAEASAQAANDRASPASVLIKEEPTAEACSQAAAQRGLCSVSDIVERCGEAHVSKVKEVHARRQEHRAAVAAFDQALRCNNQSANLASTAASGCTPPETTGGVSDVDRAAAAATAAVVGALPLKQACRPPGIKAEAMDVSREMDDGRFVTKPARIEVAKAEEPPEGMPDRAAAGLPDQASAEALEQASAEAPEEAPGGSRAAAAPPAGASKSGAAAPRRRLTARKTTSGGRPPAPVYPAAAPAAFVLPEQVHVEVLPAGADESTDDELVHEIYSEEVHAMLRQAYFARSCRRNFKRGLELLPISYYTIPSRAAQKKAEEAVQDYFALTAEDKRAYMRSRVEVFEISDAFVDHPALSFNVATMRHLDNDRQVERGLRAVRDMPAFTLMGEYCGVVKTGDAAEAASAEDPMGFGGLKNDKLKDFCHSHPDRNIRPQGLWSEGMELVVDPCKAGNALRYINDYQGMPRGVTKNVATVEVFDHDTLRPHILFFTIEAVFAGEELLMDYGEQFRRFILSEGNRAKSLVAARKAAAEAQREVETANAKTAEAMEEVLRARDVVQMAIQEAEDAYAEARLARKEARKAKREKAELENLLKKHGIKH